MGGRRGLRIGTRGSALAMWQARHVARRLAEEVDAARPELVVIPTGGDRLSDVPLSQVEGKAFFTKEIEDALLGDEIDCAVHSLKDLATTMPQGLTLGAVLTREDPRDVLIARPAVSSLDALARGARVGTSSLRRRAFLARWRPDLDLVDLRGNVPTRLARLDGDEAMGLDALVLAAAGIHRLDLASRIAAYLPVDRLPPAAGQGAIAVQIRVCAADIAGWISRLDDRATRAATAAERAFLRRLEGGCQAPVGALAEATAGGLAITGAVCSLDGRRAVEGRREAALGDGGDQGQRWAAAELLGTALAEDLLRRGADEILAEIRR